MFGIYGGELNAKSVNPMVWGVNRLVLSYTFL